MVTAALAALPTERNQAPTLPTPAHPTRKAALWQEMWHLRALGQDSYLELTHFINKKVTQRRLSDLSLEPQYLTQTKQADLQLRFNISLRERKRRAHRRTPWRAVTAVNSNDAGLRGMENSTQTQTLPIPAGNGSRQNEQCPSFRTDRNTGQCLEMLSKNTSEPRLSLLLTKNT